MKISVGITTVLDHRWALLGQTLQSLHDSGFHDVHLSYDDETFGPYGNFQKCLREMIGAEDSDAYLVFQDDIISAVGLHDWLREHLTPVVWNVSTGCISLYCAGPHHQEQDGWFRLLPCEGRRSYGALALLFPHFSASAFLEEAPNKGCKTRTCFWVAEWCKATNRDYWIHSPSLILHAGDESIVNPDFDKAVACKPFRQAAVWWPDVNDDVVVDLREAVS